MSEIPLNKFEREKRVIELHLQGKTIREIAKEVHMSFRDISQIIKTYERKKELQAKREESNQSSQPKKPSKVVKHINSFWRETILLKLLLI